MITLFINIQINTREKLSNFKNTVKLLVEHFTVCLIKVRGSYAAEALDYFNSIYEGDVKSYQGLPENDWVATTKMMLGDVRTRSVFLYFEDHRLLKDGNAFKNLLENFEASSLDYLPYSFFRASRLSKKNLLPFKPVRINDICIYEINNLNINYYEKISPGYYIFSLLSIASVDYFKRILDEEDAQFKIKSKILLKLLSLTLPYPKNRNFLYKFNNKFQKIFNVRFGLYERNAPFNMERHWAENLYLGQKNWNFGLLLQEYFANFDDDNGADNESLIKRGLFPFENNPNLNEAFGTNSLTQSISLNPNEEIDLTYISARERVSTPPILIIEPTFGPIYVTYSMTHSKINAKETKMYYPNLGITAKSTNGDVLKITLINY